MPNDQCNIPLMVEELQAFAGDNDNHPRRPALEARCGA